MPSASSARLKEPSHLRGLAARRFYDAEGNQYAALSHAAQYNESQEEAHCGDDAGQPGPVAGRLGGGICRGIAVLAAPATVGRILEGDNEERVRELIRILREEEKVL